MADVSRRVSLIFEADTSAAKNSINELVRSLQSIQSKPTDLVNTDSIKTASKAALELQEHLRKAVNVDTGKLDLSRFVTSLNSSKKTLEDYRVALNRIGPEGNRAFIQLAHNINNSETSTVRLNKTMQNFLNTLKNTVKWQISSNITHGLESTISHAYNYAKQLDGVLNDIRIVSGKSAEEMANFAVAANKSAQELSTTTSKYAEASLIFFQQGLSDAAVKERTDTVIKMANITGEAMTDVSSYMTAIWNNFADGTKNLEYYADVIVKLGADTASSSEEIAGGLEKFIAIGDQIGLSYEYAAAALTTITAQTRQSEDVVGTALRTIFARIQGLSLGETLDDGTDLNKYSSALQKVGVNIKDASGQLKDMDVILDDLGSKWGTLGRDTQIALAQTVGGVRQYNQIIALMDNWEFFQKNLQTAYSSEGSVEKQAAIYEESWRAAENRVKAAAEGIYDALLDEKIFIQLDGFFTKILNTVQGVVEGMGGMVPILATIGGFIATRFAKEVPVMISNFKENLAIFSGKSGTKALEEQSKLTENLQKKLRAAKPGTEEAAELTSLERVSRMREELLKNQKNMNSAQIEEYENLIKVEQAIGRINTERAKGIEQSKLQAQESASLLEDEILLSDVSDKELLERTKKIIKADKGDFGVPIDDESLLSYMKDSNFDDGDLNAIDQLSATGKEKLEALKKQYNTGDLFSINLKKQSDEMLKYAKASGEVSAELNKLKNLQKNVFNNKDLKPAEQTELSIKGIKQALQELKNTVKDSGEETSFLDKIENGLNDIENSADAPADKLKNLQDLMDQLNKAAEKYRGIMSKKSNEASENLIAAGVDSKVVTQAKTDAHMAGIKGQAYPVETGEGTPIEEPKIDPTSKSEAFTTLAATAMEAYGAIQAVQSAWETFNDADASGFEKLGAAIGGLMSITMAVNGIVQLNNTLANLSIVLSARKTLATIAETAATTLLAKAKQKLAVAANAALGALGFVMAAIVALIALISHLVNRETEQEKKLRLLKEESEALAAAQENLEQKISDVQSAWDNYDQAVKALEECTVGTKEWTDALLETNQAVLNLLAISPELSELVQYGENGELRIVGMTAEQAMEELTRRNTNLQAQSVIVDAQTKNAELELKGNYGNEAQLLDVQKAYGTYLSSMEEAEELTLTEQYNILFDFVQSIKDFFGEDEESFKNFLDSTGITISSYLFDSNGSTNSLYDFWSQAYDGAENNIYDITGTSGIGETLKVWQSTNKEREANDKTIESGYITLLGQTENFDPRYAAAYTYAIERKLANIEDELNDVPKEELIDEMVRLYGGTEEEYDEQSIEVLRRQIAWNRFSQVPENFSDITANVASFARGSTEEGRRVLQAQGQGAYIDFNAPDISSEGLSIIEPLADEVLNSIKTIETLNSELDSELDKVGAVSQELSFYTDSNINTDITGERFNQEIVARNALDEAEALREKNKSANAEIISIENELSELSDNLPAVDPDYSSAITKLVEKTGYSIETLYTELASLAEPAIIYSQYSGFKDENGKSLFTEEELTALSDIGYRGIKNPTATSVTDALSFEAETQARIEGLTERKENLITLVEENEAKISALEDYAADALSDSQDSINMVADYLRAAGIEIEDEQINLGSGVSIEEAISYLQGILQNRGNDLSQQLESAVTEYEEEVEKALLSYFGEGDNALQRLETFKEDYGYDSNEDLFEEMLKEDGIAYRQIGIENFLFENKDLISPTGMEDFMDLSLEEQEKSINEYAARIALYTYLFGKNRANWANFDFTSLDDSEYLKSILTIYGFEGETALDAIDTFNTEKAVARGAAIKTWNTDRGVTDSSEIFFDETTGRYEYSGELAGAKKAFDTEITPDDLIVLSQLYSTLQSSMNEENFKTFDSLLADMISFGTDISTISNIVNAASSRIVSEGRKLTETDLIEILEELGISAESLGVETDDLTASLNNTVSAAIFAANAFDVLCNSLAIVKKGLSDLQEDTEFSKEEWEEIEPYILAEYEDKFLETAEGGTVFTGTDEEAEELRQAVLMAQAEQYVNNTAAIRELETEGGSVDSFKDTMRLEEGSITSENVRAWLNPLESEEGNATAQNLATNIAEILGIEASTTDADGTTVYTDEIIGIMTSILNGEYTQPERVSEVLATSGLNDENIYKLQQERVIFDEDANYAYRENWEQDVEDLGLDVEEVDTLGDSIQETAESSEYLADSLKDDAQAADEVAKELMRYNRGLEAVKDNTDDWTKSLKNNTKGSVDYTNTIDEMTEALEDIYDLDEGSLKGLDLDWERLNKDMKIMAEGTAEEAAAAYQDGIDAINDAAVLEAGLVPDLDMTQFESGLSDSLVSMNEWQNLVYDALNNIEAGGIIDGPLLSSLESMLNACYSTATEAQNALTRMGVDGQVVVAEEPITNSTPTNDIRASVVDNGYLDVPIIAADGSISVGQKIPIQGVKYTAVSSVNTSEGAIQNVGFKIVPGTGKTNVTRKAGGRAKSSMGSRPARSGGGGGGGGGGGSRAPRAERKTSTDKDRYRTVKNQLEDLTDTYDKVSTAADRAFGETKLELLKQQEKAIQDLISKQREYIDEINEYYDIDRKAVEEVSSRLGFAVEFDANGTITNWDEIQNQMIDEYNSHINDKGEVIGMDEEAWEKYEKEWERVMALFEQYDETQDLRKEALQQLQDYANQLYDLQLQEVTYVVEIKIDATDDALEILDYMLGRIEDDAWAAAEAIAYMGQKAAEIQLQNNTYTEGIRGILMNHTRDLVDSEGNIVNSASLTVEDVEGFMSGQEAAIKKIMGLNEEFTDEEVQQLREYNSSLIEMNETLNDLRNEVFDKVLDSFEAFNDEMDRSIDKIDHLSSLTENYANIIDIVGQKNLEISNALMESISQATVDQATNRVEATREKMLTIQDEIARAEEALADAKSKGLEEDVKLWEDTLKEMHDSLDEAEEEFLQSWEDALSAATDAFEASMDRAISAFGDALAGPLLGSLEQLEEMFDRQNTIADRYLPDYEKIYELNKLNRDITNSIDETDNIRAKQELAALQEEINKLEEDGVQVSEYQVENLRRRYELKLAELALTESQNAKSEVRMTRNADGDWSYVYVADEEQVAEAEQNYEDKLFAMQQANAEYINNLNDMLIQLRVNTFNSLQEIWEDETLSQEEKIAKTNELFAYAQEQMGYYMDELGLVLGENQILYEQDWAKYSELTGYKISANEDYVDHFNETALSLLTGYETMEEFQQNFNDAIGHPDSGGFLYDLDNAFKTWEANTEEIFNSAGTSMEDFKDVVEDSVNDIVENSEEATESIEEMGDNVVSTFDEITNAVENWSNTYSETIDNILSRNEMLTKSFNELLKAWAGFEDATEIEEGTAPGEDTEAGNESDSGETDNGENVAEDGLGTITIRWGRMNIRKEASADSKDLGTVDARGKKLSYVYTKKQGVWVYVPDLGGWVHGNWHDGKYTYLTPFDTGGYTGSWGAEGRVAMLHEKELVLNKQDTSNLLAAVGMIRDISKIIDLNAYASSYGNITSTPNVVDNTGTLEQQVHITAEFPNATDKDEILSAFDDIINLASQYANRR